MEKVTLEQMDQVQVFRKNIVKAFEEICRLTPMLVEFLVVAPLWKSMNYASGEKKFIFWRNEANM